ncbi:MAG: hypothetical protein ABH846_04875 [Patescibacteria group bacterium]
MTKKKGKRKVTPKKSAAEAEEKKIKSQASDKQVETVVDEDAIFIDDDAPVDEANIKPTKEEGRELREMLPEDEDVIQKGLNEIYGKEKVDFSRLDRGRSRLTSILLTIVITLFVIALTAWAGFFVYTKYFTPQEEAKFNVSIDVSEELISGQEATIKIAYENPTVLPIASLSIDARIPASFHIETMNPMPSNEEDLVWEIGTLGAGSDGQIIIDGIWIAEAPSSTSVQVFANYRPSNFNADFQDIETVYISTLDSHLTAEFEGPEEATSGQLLNYKIKLTNGSKVAFENIEARLDIPDGFFLESSEPEIQAGFSPIWKIEKIEPEEIVEITINGSFAADAEGFQYFDLTTGIISEERFLTQEITQGFTDVMGTNFDLQIVANGSTQDVSVDLNDKLRMTLAYENTGSDPLENVEVLLDFQSEKPIPIIWNQADLDGGNITSDGVKWSIKDLLPNEKQILNLTFPVDSKVGSGQTDVFSIVASAAINEMTVRSTPIEIMINTEANFSAEIMYFNSEGAPLGNGPLPPEVGQKTTYRAFWRIENSLHDLSDVKVSAILPPDAVWEDQAQTDLGKITFNPADRSVTWTIVNLPKSITRIEANFAISITPDPDDVGTFIKMISGSSLSATDVMTKISIQKTTDSLTTDLEQDEFAEGKGAVIEN